MKINIQSICLEDDNNNFFMFNPLFEEEVVNNLDISDSLSDEPETISSGGASYSSGYGSNTTTSGKVILFGKSYFTWIFIIICILYINLIA